MTNQEAFDKMMEHLRSLKGPSMDSCGIDCVYNGTMCVVGALMTDEEQEKFGDYSGSVDGLLAMMSLEGHTSALHTLSKDFLGDMQNLHDFCYNWGDEGFTAEVDAEEIANEYRLTYTKP